jgi:hypothetical protein
MRLLIILLLMVGLQAAEEAKWQSLFDGKTLTGWETAKKTPVAKGWIVEDGCIFRNAKGGSIFTVSEYENFELEFEWKISANGNSGVKYRTNGQLGPEYQVLDDDGHKNGKNPLTSAAALYAMVSCNDQKALKPVGEFNTGRIVAHGTKLEHWLNGKKVMETDTSSAEWAKAKASSKYRDKEGYGTGSGRLMLQDHGNLAWYRNLRIRPLD